MMDEDRLRDPLPLFEGWIVDMGLATDAELTVMRQAIQQRIEQCSLEAEQIPFPTAASATTKVFKESCPIIEEEASPQTEAIVMMDALNHALDEEMERDPSVIVFGQDVAHGKGGVFGITRNLTAKYGKERCFNTPLAESTIIGIALGMSLVDSFKPVAEIQFADYMWTGVNQLFNELASFHYRSDGEWNCPVVIRMPYGGYIQGGPYHSQSIEAFLSHCPGLKVVVPSNAADAKRLLKTAIRDPNPVIFLEHKALYRQRVFCARSEPGQEALLPFGKANIVRKGEDITLICYGMMVPMAVEAAEKLSQEGISVEIIDLRTLVPLDMHTVMHSVRKTGKALIAHEAPKTCGFGAEIAARIAEEGFAYLDAPVVRIGGKDCPMPYAKQLEEVVLPQTADLEKALIDLANF
jgi:2-oxoisovalerate dehydrogenase E1 component